MLNLRKISLLGLLLSCSLTSIGSPICVASPTEAHRILMTKNPFSESSIAAQPTKTQANPRTAISATPTTTASSRASALLEQSQTVNINQADAAALARVLSGIGEKKAQAIIEYRNAHGAFATIDDLDHVKGIGPATIDKNRARIRLQ